MAIDSVRRSKMSKKLIFGLALATVLISGSFIGAQADRIGPMCWAGSCPDVQSDVDQPKRDMDRTNRDMDKPDATGQGTYQYGPTTPSPFPSPF
jgi:hypothetical protein